MKIVLDTNVIFSAFAVRGLSHAVFELCLQQHEIQVSEKLLIELKKNLALKLKMPPAAVAEVLVFLREFCCLVEPNELKKQVCRDPNDDHIIGLALACGADCIVSGDRDLLSLGAYGRITILNPRQFWESLKKRP